MASGKKNYFRHSFFASEDQKIQSVIDSMGFEGYGYYFSLLEMCGRQCSEEMKNPIIFHIQTIRKVWRKNAESTKKVLRKLEESGLFLVTFSEHSVSLDIPSFGKYLGKYDSNTPNKRKENERKENKIKEKETVVKVSPLSFLFDKWPDVQEWLNDGSHETHSLLVSKFSHHVLAEEVPKLFEWANKKEVRAESWMHTKLLNVETTVYGANKPKAAFKSRGHGVASTPQNPTGNPYIQEAIEKGYIA